MIKERKRNRLMGYDYSQDNLYFVTSCVKDRICCFGEIVNQKMVLNEYGLIAEKQWFWLGEQYSYLKLHAFVVMPNHIHGIIEIKRDYIVGTGRDCIVGTGRDLSLQYNRYQKIKPLSQLMGAYKTTTSKQIHLSGNISFNWQRSFHDHIIRNEQAYERISNYIINNSMKWNEDRFNEL
jgi:putative transposase